jgi:hypothetical protein
MTGTSLAGLLVICAVVVAGLTIWLVLVFWAGRHPFWTGSRPGNEPAAPDDATHADSARRRAEG